ncbi:MAG: hypothetical protein HND55_12470 [Pseudomonadota bacterium]|nr:MAG: hypothetical protein HND55_12470 [Pseudomonadota bacterium]
MIARVEAGESLETLPAAGITAEHDEQWGRGFISPERWVALLYRDVQRQD